MHTTKNTAIIGTTIVLLHPVLARAGTSIIPIGSPEGCDFSAGLKAASDAGGAARCVPIFIGLLIQFVLGFVGAFCLINIMIGGFHIAFGSAVGDKEAGKSRVLWALVGLFVSLISYGLINLVITTLGL